MLAALAMGVALWTGTPARAAPPARAVEVQTMLPQPDLSLAYRGTGSTLVHPGAALGLTWNLRQRDVRVERRRPRHRTRTWYAGVTLGTSTRMFNNTLVAAQAVGGTRLVRTAGATTGWSLGFGPNRTFLNHPTWRTDEAGEVHRVWLRGQWSTATTLSWEYGWEVQRWRALRGRREPLAQPLQWYVRPSLTVLAPWLDLQAPVITVDVGVRAPITAWGGAR